MLLTACACSELIFPTGASHFRASVTQTTNDEKIVRACGTTSSARTRLAGFATLRAQMEQCKTFLKLPHLQNDKQQVGGDKQQDGGSANVCLIFLLLMII